MQKNSNTPVLYLKRKKCGKNYLTVLILNKIEVKLKKIASYCPGKYFSFR